MFPGVSMRSKPQKESRNPMYKSKMPSSKIHCVWCSKDVKSEDYAKHLFKVHEDGLFEVADSHKCKENPRRLLHNDYYKESPYKLHVATGPDSKDIFYVCLGTMYGRQSKAKVEAHWAANPEAKEKHKAELAAYRIKYPVDKPQVQAPVEQNEIVDRKMWDTTTQGGSVTGLDYGLREDEDVPFIKYKLIKREWYQKEKLYQGQIEALMEEISDLRHQLAGKPKSTLQKVSHKELAAKEVFESPVVKDLFCELVNLVDKSIEDKYKAVAQAEHNAMEAKRMCTEWARGNKIHEPILNESDSMKLFYPEDTDLEKYLHQWCTKYNIKPRRSEFPNIERQENDDSDEE